MLGVTPLPRTLEAAIRDTEDRKVRVRLSALRDLARHGGGPDRQRVLSALERVLQADDNSAVRAEAAVALADAGATESVGALLSALDDVEVRVRQMAVLALGEVGSRGEPRTVAAIEDAIGDEAAALRYQGLIAAARLDAPGVLEALCRALSDDDEHVRYIALRLLEERCSDDDGVTLPAEVADLTSAALDDSAFSVRLAAAVLLARGGDPSGRDVIVRAIGRAGRSAHAEDLEHAIRLAGELGFDEAMPALARRAFGTLGASRDPFAWQSRIALCRLGDARARQSILGALSAWSRDTRTLAVAAAGQAGLLEAAPRLSQMKGNERLADPEAVEEALRLLEAEGL